jgi:excisionase family DNA binding protein
VPLRLPDGDTYLTTTDACALLQVSRTSLYVWRMENRAPPSIKWGRQRLYPRNDLIAWYDAKVAEAIEADGASND